MASPRGFLEALFDFSFSEFITTRIIRWLYALMMIVWGLLVIVMVMGEFTKGLGTGLLSLMLSPLIFLLGVIISRIYLELVIVIFRIAELLKQLVSLSAPWAMPPSP